MFRALLQFAEDQCATHDGLTEFKRAVVRCLLVGRYSHPSSSDDTLRQLKEDAPCLPLPRLLAVSRLIVTTDREAYEFCGPLRSCCEALCRGPLSPWNEQQAVKKARQFLLSCAAGPPAAADGDGGSASFQQHDPPLWKQLLDELAAYAVVLAPPSVALSEDESKSIPPERIEKVDVFAPEPGGSPAIGVVHCVTGVASEEGKMVLLRPIPAFGTILRVPLTELFTIDTAVATCPLAKALRTTWREQIPDDGNVLLLSLVFQKEVLGPRSPWRALIDTFPKEFPTFPAFWCAADLAWLEGCGLREDAEEKEVALERFADSAKALLALALPVALAELLSSPEYGFIGEGVEKALGCFSLLNIQWAQAVINSRAMHLNYNGTQKLALVPVADMLNHCDQSHVIARRVDTAEGVFTLEVGAALGPEQVGKELVMSYGPLQNWELLSSYGFALPGGTPYDVLPFPATLDLEEECVAGDGVDYRAWRKAVAAAHFVAPPASGEWWIPRSGVPPPNLLAMLRLVLAPAECFPAMEADPFATLVSADAEGAVLDAVEAVVSAVLARMPSPLEDDEALLCTLSASPSALQQQENRRLAVAVRCGLKRIARSVLVWVAARRATAS